MDARYKEHLDTVAVEDVESEPERYTFRMSGGCVVMKDNDGSRRMFYRGFEVEDHDYDRHYGRYAVGKERGMFTLKEVRAYVDRVKG